ncbi:MAG: hypothetical protein WCL29_08585, partial [Pseudomonadota bacterium]
MTDGNSPDPTASSSAATSLPPPIPERDLTSEKNTLHLLYAMHGIAPFTLWTLAIVAMIVGAVKRDDARGTWLDTHYSWLARTFWFGLLWWVIAWGVFWVLGLLTLGIGMIVLWIFPAAGAPPDVRFGAVWSLATTACSRSRLACSWASRCSLMADERVSMAARVSLIWVWVSVP